MKRKTKIALLAGIAAVATLLCSSCGKSYTGRTQTFEPGQHTLGVNLGPKLETDYVQIPNHAGYEPISAGVDYWHWIILYKNTVEVECAETTRGFIEFGTPVQKDATLSLAMED